MDAMSSVSRETLAGDVSGVPSTPSIPAIDAAYTRTRDIYIKSKNLHDFLQINHIADAENPHEDPCFLGTYSRIIFI